MGSDPSLGLGCAAAQPAHGSLRASTALLVAGSCKPQGHPVPGQHGAGRPQRILVLPFAMRVTNHAGGLADLGAWQPIALAALTGFCGAPRVWWGHVGALLGALFLPFRQARGPGAGVGGGTCRTPNPRTRVSLPWVTFSAIARKNRVVVVPSPSIPCLASLQATAANRPPARTNERTNRRTNPSIPKPSIRALNNTPAHRQASLRFAPAPCLRDNDRRHGRPAGRADHERRRPRLWIPARPPGQPHRGRDDTPGPVQGIPRGEGAV